MAILERSDEWRDLFGRIRTVAIVGMSPDPGRASHDVAQYLHLATDWTIWYVNPREHQILGRPVHPSLADLPAAPDLVDVFRRPAELPTVVDESIAVGAGAVWFQLGLVHDGAATTASTAGLDVVQDRCLKIEYDRLMRPA